MDDLAREEIHDLARTALHAVQDEPICGHVCNEYGLRLVCAREPHKGKRHVNEAGTVTWIG